MEEVYKQIDKSKLPGHIAVIMDGNGRWAKKQGKNRLFGHQNGVEAVRNTVEVCAQLGVKYLTLYAFSTENWQRPIEEVNALMELLVSTINSEIHQLHDKKISLKSIGDTDKLPDKCLKELKEAEKLTSGNNGLCLVLALSYSARWDIINASKKIAKKVKSGQLSPEQINEETFRANLTTNEIPDPELIIRTSGEKRISNFLLWESAYTEFYFSEKNWPEFTKEDACHAIIDFQNRERRFGKISEQIS